jgi:hypothetical protein
MMFLRPDSGYADAGESSSRSGPGPGRFCGCFYVLLLALRVDPSVDIALGSWKLPVHMIEAESYLGVRSTDLRYLYTCEDGVRLNYVLRPSHSDVRFGTERSQSVLNGNVQSYNRPAEPTGRLYATRLGDPYAVPCRAVPRPRRAGLSTNRARCRSLPRRTGRGNSRSRRALRLSPSRGPPLLRGVRSYHCVPRAIAPSAGSDGTYT